MTDFASRLASAAASPVAAHHSALEAVVAEAESAFSAIAPERAARVRFFAGRVHDELDAIAQHIESTKAV
jgi:hypothetical protein